MASMFKKPRRNFRKKGGDADSDNENDTKEESMDVDEDVSMSAKLEKEKKKKPKVKDKESRSKTVLSFDAEDEEEEIAARIGSELKRMQRRKQLFYPTAHSPPLSTTCSALGRQSPPLTLETLTSQGSSSDFPSLSSYSASGTSSPKQKDVPLFTFRQVAMICERLVREHEDKVRESYDKVLTNKLSEQYEAFLKFNHDQLQKRFGNAPMSYVS